MDETMVNYIIQVASIYDPDMIIEDRNMLKI